MSNTTNLNYQQLQGINLTPKEIVSELDKYVIGQNDAKISVANALRNRWRRRYVEDEIKNEIYPSNILMVGPTGVGKTEIARRLAKLTRAPFIKIEATKFTEVGYVGKDVEAIIRDLLDIAIKDLRKILSESVREQAVPAAESRIINALVGENSSEETRAKFLQRFKDGELDDKEIEISVKESVSSSSMPSFDIPGMPGGQMGVFNLSDVLGKAIGGKTKKMRMTVSDAYKQVLKEESDKLLDEEKLVEDAIKAVENDGIVFIDEIDKIASRSDVKGEVSREGVQRDLLPIIEGTTVTTKHGFVQTDHILFIASGAFHVAKPSDLLPELQSRLPNRVELKALNEAELIRILTEPKFSLTKQYVALFKVEDVTVKFTECGVNKIASIAAKLNQEVENIGARRLRTILEKLFEGLNFTANETPGATITVDEKYVETNLGEIANKEDLSDFIL